MTERVWAPYCGPAPLPDEWLERWNFDPWLLAAFGLAWLAWRRWGGSDRPAPPAAAAALALVLLVSPFCALTSALFSARAVHHVVLVAVVAPLLVAGLPRRWGTRLPVAGWTALHALAFWLWHAPPFYAWALSTDAAYWGMQVSLLASAMAFWASIRSADGWIAAGALLATMVQMGLLGALLTFARTPLYAPHWLSTAPWGLTPLEDQQLAGLIMWAPGGALYLGAAIVLAARWLGREPAGVAAS